MKITENKIKKFAEHLKSEEKAAATVKKYVRDVSVFAAWLCGREITRELVLAYKEELKEKYLPASVNAAIASLNSFFEYIGRGELRLKSLKIQRKLFAAEDRELKREEYKRLLRAAKKAGNRRLRLIMQTLFVTGIRIPELKYITVEAAERGTAVIDCKGKMREVFIPKDMRGILKKYIKDMGIGSGCVFITATGKPVDRSNIAKAMKRTAEMARVPKEKVFPHNFRHLFARVYYSAYKDISRLADILGHTSVNTTRIYTRESGDVHRRQIELLRLTS